MRSNIDLLLPAILQEELYRSLEVGAKLFFVTLRYNSKTVMCFGQRAPTIGCHQCAFYNDNNYN